MDDWRTSILSKLGQTGTPWSGMAAPAPALGATPGMAGPTALPPGQTAAPIPKVHKKQESQGFLMNPALNPVAGIYNPGGWCK